MIRLGRKREMWMPTWPGCAAVVAVLALFALWAVANVHGFLAVTDPAPGANALVVEGWIADSSLKIVADKLAAPNSPYETILVTGPLMTHGYYLADKFKSYSELGAASLRALGVPPERMIVATAVIAPKDRTYQAAIALKQELERRGKHYTAFDLVTEDVHARRSRAVYEKVFGRETRVGVLALPPIEYDSELWLRTSAGVKNTAFELVATLYEWCGAGR
jgi:uncharacterized SAM-binding protein YcdF (DUF218 family)